MAKLGFIYEILQLVEKIADRNHVPGKCEIALARDLDLNLKLIVDWAIPSGDKYRLATKINLKFVLDDNIPIGFIEELGRRFEAKIWSIKKGKAN